MRYRERMFTIIFRYYFRVNEHQFNKFFWLGRAGDDSYDGHSSNDIIREETLNVERLVSNDDVISGGEGRDYIFIGEGFDRIEGDPANDRVHPNDHDWRGFSYLVNCGSGTFYKVSAYTQEGMVKPPVIENILTIEITKYGNKLVNIFESQQNVNSSHRKISSILNSV